MSFSGMVSDGSASCIYTFDCDQPTGVIEFSLTRSDGVPGTVIAPLVPSPTYSNTSEADYFPPVSLPAFGYSGSWDYEGNFDDFSVDVFFNFTVSKRSCATQLTQSIGATAPGGSVVLTAKVSTAVPSYGPATGTVTFYQDDGTAAPDVVLDTATVDNTTNTAVSDNVGPVLPAGATTPIYAVYGGDLNHVADCKSNVVSHQVTANPQPTAQNDSVFVLRDGVAVFAPLANDAHPNGLALIPEVIDGPSNGSLDTTSNLWTYEPDDGFIGDDVIHYFVSDANGNQSTAATIAIEVGCESSPGNDQYTTAFDTALVVNTSAASFLANDDTCERSVGLVADPTNGAISAFDGANGTFTYTPEAGFSGLDGFSYSYTYSGKEVLGFATIVVLPDPTTDTTTSTTTTTTAPPTPNEQRLASLYGTLLDRAPDAAGLAYWLPRLDGGTHPEIVGRSLVDSAEFRRRMVTESFQRFLGRQPDPSGLTYWTQRLAVDSPDVMRATMLSSNEAWTRAGGVAATWTNQAFTAMLGRNATPDEHLVIDGRIDTAGKRSAAATDIAGFVDARRHLATVWYDELLGRAPTTTERNAWGSAMIGGRSEASLITQLAVDALPI